MKYTRKWEDESAYAKQSIQVRNPRPEDFPELGSKGERRKKDNSQQDLHEEKENKLRQNYQLDDDNRNFPKRSVNRQMSDRQMSDRQMSDRQMNDRQMSDRPMNDRRDNERPMNDRRDSDRRDNSRSLRPHERYSGRGNKHDFDDRRKIKDKGYKNRSGREFKNQNRNKNNDYEGRSSGGMYNRSNSGNHSETRNQPHHHQHDDEHVESISFTNSKLNNNSNRYSNVEYSNVGANIGSMQGRDYGVPQMTQEPTMVIIYGIF